MNQYHKYCKGDLNHIAKLYGIRGNSKWKKNKKQNKNIDRASVPISMGY